MVTTAAGMIAPLTRTLAKNWGEEKQTCDTTPCLLIN